MRLEFLQIGIRGVHEADLLVDHRHVAIDVERAPVVVGILERPDAHGVAHA